VYSLTFAKIWMLTTGR